MKKITKLLAASVGTVDYIEHAKFALDRRKLTEREIELELEQSRDGAVSLGNGSRRKMPHTTE